MTADKKSKSQLIQELIEMLLIVKDKLISELKTGNKQSLDEVSVHFAPTAAYQEHSMANGWSDEYLKIAEEFDHIKEMLQNIVGHRHRCKIIGNGYTKSNRCSSQCCITNNIIPSNPAFM